jgi:hypothetical protein
MKLADYFKINLKFVDNKLQIGDYLLGFDENLQSEVLTEVVKLAKEKNISTIETGYVFPQEFNDKYGIKFCYKEELIGFGGWEEIITYKQHPEQDFKNFICSFNGAGHVSRQLLVSALNKFGYFNKDYCSKNFEHPGSRVDGLVGDNIENTAFYNKFFDLTDEFNQQTYRFGQVVKGWDLISDHANNVYALENKLAESFLHIVSETMATSYYPWVTEKFLYSIVTRGLFLSYAQPGWHAHIEKVYGFKLYTKLFDYRFDSITNPVKRLVELMTMVSKFSKLTPAEWHDLYRLEVDTIEYNYNHYYSKEYLKYIKDYEESFGNKV